MYRTKYAILHHSRTDTNVYIGIGSTCTCMCKSHFKPRCLKPPGLYLCTPEPGRPGCVIFIRNGVNGDVNPVAISQKVTKNLPVSFFLSHTGVQTHSFHQSSGSSVGRAPRYKSHGRTYGFESNCWQEFFILYFVVFGALLAGRLVPYK